MAHDQGTRMISIRRLILPIAVILGHALAVGVKAETVFEPGHWESWTARDELAPHTDFNAKAGEWSVTGNGKPMRHGGWDLHWDRLPDGAWHEFSIDCRATDIASVHDNAHAEIIYWKADGKRADWRHVNFQLKDDGHLRYSTAMPVPTNAVRATARLMLRWTAKGELHWKNPSLRPTNKPDSRIVKMAIITGRPPGTSVAANLDFTEKLIRRAASKGARVVSLPEVITTWRIRQAAESIAVRIPGPETQRFEALARELGVDINFSMHELDEAGLVYNTAVYFDSSKGLIGKYRKVHLAVGERWKGITPGNEFPVWTTAFGKAGMLICYDNVHPEGHRILSQKGAEVIFLPIMGDPRAVGNRAYDKWLQIMSVRAMDNHVWMVICQNNGDRGVIIRPDGEVLCEVDPGSGFAIAEIDLNFRHASWIGSDFLNRNWGERRPSVYRELSRDR